LPIMFLAFIFPHLFALLFSLRSIGRQIIYLPWRITTFTHYYTWANFILFIFSFIYTFWMILYRTWLNLILRQLCCLNLQADNIPIVELKCGANFLNLRLTKVINMDHVWTSTRVISMVHHLFTVNSNVNLATY